MASQNLINIIIQAQDKASETAKKVDDSLRNIGKTSSTLSKVPGLDGLKSKLGDVATSIDNKFGGALTRARNRFSSFGNSVSNVGSTIKGKFGGAIDGVRNKLSSFSNGSKGLASSMSFLKGAVSMTAGLIGFELVSGLVQAGREAINAASKLDYFGQRLANASGKTKLSASEFTKFKGELAGLQKEFRKVDMTAVGATAEEIALKMNLPANKLSDLTRMTAVMSSTFVKEGRTQEDAVLAVGDALDGQFRRLQEIGITQDKLKQNGWNGNLEDQAGLIDALNKTMQEMGYEQTAKDITNLDEAYTALTIAGGQLLQSVLVPLTPILIEVINAVINATDAIKGFVSGLANLPGWAKIGLAIGAVAIGIGLLGGAIAAAGGLIPILTGALAPLAAAILAISWPVVAVVAAVGLLVAAVYEIGKAFGWWTDVGSMLDAITAGLGRLWSAFINHPDVQALISGLVWAWNGLVSAIGGAWNAIVQFLTGATGGEFDVVRAIIDGIGAAWDSMKLRIQLVVFVFQTLYNGIMFVVNGIQWLAGIFSSAWTNITSTTNLNAFQILNIIFSTIGRIPALFSQFLLQALTRIVTVGALWVNKARAMAREVVTGIITYITQLPGKVYNALVRVVDRIKTAITLWKNKAIAMVKELISKITSPFTGVAGKIGDALGGVADALTKPFRDAWSWIKPYYDKIKGALDIIPSFGGEEVNGVAYYGGEELPTVNVSSTPTVDNTPIEINDNINLTLDFSKVPRHINTGDLIEAFQDQSVLNALVNNRNFQDLDAKVKTRIELKTKRSRGL